MTKKILTPVLEDTLEKTIENTEGIKHVVRIGDFTTVIYSDEMTATELLMEAERLKAIEEVKNNQEPI